MPSGSGGQFPAAMSGDAGTGKDSKATTDTAGQPRSGQGKYPSKGGAHKSGGGGNWTVLLYSMADTDLETYMLDDILEMAEVGSGPTLNLIVQVDRAA